MCLSSNAFALFLSLLSPEIVSTSPGEITIHAAVADKTWERVGAPWCTDHTQTASAD